MQSTTTMVGLNHSFFKDPIIALISDLIKLKICKFFEKIHKMMKQTCFQSIWSPFYDRMTRRPGVRDCAIKVGPVLCFVERKTPQFLAGEVKKTQAGEGP